MPSGRWVKRATVRFAWWRELHRQPGSRPVMGWVILFCATKIIASSARYARAVATICLNSRKLMTGRVNLPA